MTVGGDKLDYPDETASSTASFIETKLLVNSVISDHKLNNAKFCSIDIKDFFLTTSMARYCLRNRANSTFSYLII